MPLEETTEIRRTRRGQAIDASCWGLFFIWLGVVMLLPVMPKGVGALGVGAIVLGGAVLRLVVHASVSTFWIVIGTIFVLAGVGEFFAIDLPLLPIALITCGVLLLFHSRAKRRVRR